MRINEKELYNPEIKERFLKSYSSDLSTIKYTKISFLKFSDIERQFKKDLCEFNEYELQDLFRYLSCKSVKALGVERSKIESYIKWACDEGYALPNMILSTLRREDLDKYINKTAVKQQYFTRKEILEQVDKLYNYQDKALVMLLFEGVRGRANKDNTFEELKNLKPENCVWTENKLILIKNNGKQRSIPVDNTTMDILKDAIYETEYIRGNNESCEKSSKRMLKQTPYVLKTIDRGGFEQTISTTSINSKFYKFRQWLNLSYFNARNVFQSGMINKCIEIEKQNGYLTTQDYRDIYTRYGLNDSRWSDLKELYKLYKKISKK